MRSDLLSMTGESVWRAGAMPAASLVGNARETEARDEAHKYAYPTVRCLTVPSPFVIGAQVPGVRRTV